MKNASEYVVSLGGFDDLQVDMSACRDDPRLEQVVCSRPWPEGWQVKPGKKYFLRVAARVDLFEKAKSKKTKIELLSKDEAAEVQARAQALDALGLDAETRGLFLASFYAERRLFNAAVEALEEITQETSDPLVHLALGDAYVKVGLLYPALRRYNSVLNRLGATAERREIQAAAEYGLGWVHYLDDRPGPALVHFRNSKNLSAEKQFIHQAVLMIAKIEKVQK